MELCWQYLPPHCHVLICLPSNLSDYSYVSQGKVTVASIDDNEELEFTDNAFDVIGFSNAEKWDCYKLTAAVMSMGEIKFKQKGRDDQAEPDDMNFPNKVAELMGVNADEMMKVKLSKLPIQTCLCAPINVISKKVHFNVKSV